MDNITPDTKPQPKQPAKKGRKPKREPVMNEPDTIQIGEKWFVVFDWYMYETRTDR